MSMSLAARQDQMISWEKVAERNEKILDQGVESQSFT